MLTIFPAKMTTSKGFCFTDFRCLTTLAISVLINIKPTLGWNTTCPVECQCSVQMVTLYLLNDTRQLRTVNCMSRQLKRIPRDLPVDAEAILLQNNSITMHVGIKQMPQLRLLDLSHNRIQGFFGRLSVPQLEHLDLSYNFIPRVASGDNDFFAPLRNLQSLSLRGNGIRTLDGDALELPRLTRLDLAENNLMTLRSDSFSHLGLLNYLDLSVNDLSGSTFGSALDSMNLQYLNMSFNKVTVFVTDNLHVDTLDLSNNFFTVLDNSSLLANIWVSKLDLSKSTFLWKISSSGFASVEQVEYINLSENQNLTFIEDGIFTHFSNKTVINLDNSRLIQLPADILSSGSLVSLANVPLSCQLNQQYIMQSNSNLTCIWRNRTINRHELIQSIGSAEWNQSVPIILPSMPAFIKADLGSILELQCLTYADINVDGVNWVRIDERRKMEQPMMSFAGILRLGPLNFVNSGKYMCKAYNEYGSVNRSIQVNVTYAPVIIIPIMITHQYVTFAWNNSDPSIASQFRLRYFEETGQNSTLIRMITMDHLVRTYTIGNLKAGTTYKICLYLNKSGVVDELDCKNFTTKVLELTGRSYDSAYELLIVIGCISSLLFLIFMSTCVYRFYQDKQEENIYSESLSRILLSDTSAVNSEAGTPITYFNPGVDPLTPTTDLDIRAAFLPENHPYRHAHMFPHSTSSTLQSRRIDDGTRMQSTMF